VDTQTKKATASAAHAARAITFCPLWRLRHNTARPDIVRADQPQPVDALGVGEMHILCDDAAVHGDNMDQLGGVGKGALARSRSGP
jgi:hypothetical protein